MISCWRARGDGTVDSTTWRIPSAEKSIEGKKENQLRCLQTVFDEEQHTTIRFNLGVPVKFAIDACVFDSLMVVGVLERTACNEDDRAMLDEEGRVSYGNDVNANLVGTVVASSADTIDGGINVGRGKLDAKV